MYPTKKELRILHRWPRCSVALRAPQIAELAETNRTSGYQLAAGLVEQQLLESDDGEYRLTALGRRWRVALVSIAGLVKANRQRDCESSVN